MLPKWAAWRWPLLVGLVGWLAVVATRTDWKISVLSVTGPGITSDEPFSVFYGKAFVNRFCKRGREFFSDESINDTFAARSEHPPLGRWVIGWVHWLLDSKPGDGDFISIGNARVAPATALAVMLVLLTHTVALRHGTAAGVAAGLSLLLMPHVFGHAHLAALDTMVSWTYLMGILSAVWMMEGGRPWCRAPLAGILLGAALLTKMHGFFLVPLVGIWALVFYRMRSLLPLGLWGLCGLVTFFLGWQWLWHDLHTFWVELNRGNVFQAQWLMKLPHVFSRLTAYVSSSVDRQIIYVTYFGRPYKDIELPWHYPWVLFAVTVPVGLHSMGFVGLWQQVRRLRCDPRGALFLGALLFPLIVFSIPQVPVYDGVRLFLMSFPFWAMLVGQGAGWVYEWLERRWQPRWAGATVAIFFACQGYGIWHYHPFELSYYNALVGGLRGAERLGCEVTYWGDSITSDLMDKWSQVAPEGSCAVLVPTLYGTQEQAYQTAMMDGRRQKLQAPLDSPCPYLVVYNRRAYLQKVLQIIDDPNQRPLLENALEGVWLSRVYLRRPPEQTSNNSPQ